jgi:hypothetical protein
MNNWQPLFDKLKRFKQVYGHCHVPPGWEIDPALAQWIINLRDAKQRLPQPLRQQLVEIGVDFPSDDPWNRMYQQLKAYVQQYGHCYVPTDQPEYNDLYNWQRQQRQAKTLLLPLQVEQLDAIGFSWQDVSDVELRWEARYQELCAYQRRFGDTRVPEKYPENPALAGWVIRQRKLQKSGQLSDLRADKLRAIGFLWSEDVERMKEENWQNRFEQLRSYHQAYHAIDRFALRKQDYGLYLWVQTQRMMYHRHRITEARKELLDTLDFPWEKEDYARDRWGKMYQALQAYHRQHGHCRVTGPNVSETLINWVQRQRQRADLLTDEQRERLEALGFIWANELFAGRWENHYQALVNFHRQHGHCQVPKSQKDLYHWICDQKKEKASLSAERKAKLERIPGFLWANELNQQQVKVWEQVYRRFVAFQQQFGETYLLKLKQNPELHHWVNRQIHNKNKLSTYKKERLNAIDFPWQLLQERVDQLWECYYEELVAFQQQHGHCLVDKKDPSYKRLASWVANQRQKPLSADKKARLDAIGFSWPNEIAQQQWQQRLAEAKAIHQQYGYMKVYSCSQLGCWLYHQKKNFSKLSPERQQQLQGLIP